MLSLGAIIKVTIFMVQGEGNQTLLEALQSGGLQEEESWGMGQQKKNLLSASENTKKPATEDQVRNPTGVKRVRGGVSRISFPPPKNLM